MSRVDDIRNRTFSLSGQEKIHTMAGNKVPAVEDQMPAPPLDDAHPVNDAEFYGARAMEFYEYFLDKTPSQSIASNLALAAATLKASVVLAGHIRSLTDAVMDIKTILPRIPATQDKPPYAGKKRGRKPKDK
ncbi:MAG: hypothetical protein WC980_10715 [Candidatus Brocadiia bacterium]